MASYVQISVNRINELLDTIPAYENVSDIIADIMHWCDANEEPFSEALLKAEEYYDADYEEERMKEDDGA